MRDIDRVAATMARELYDEVFALQATDNGRASRRASPPCSRRLIGAAPIGGLVDG
jgi:hypothetical protein